MRSVLSKPGAVIMFMLGAVTLSCSRPTHAAGELPQPQKDVATTQPAEQSAVFAGGCFWCTEAVFDRFDGVKNVVSGYAGDSKETANYKTVCAGRSKHAEAIRITYDPSKLTYGQLLQVFFTSHDPTTLDRQGPDAGHQYRSAIFYASDEQKAVAEAYIKQLDEAKVFKNPIVTTLEQLGEFYPAEDYHQDFARQNPTHPYIRQQALPKLEKIEKLYGEKIKPATQPTPP